MGRPRKYKTETERKAAKRAQTNASKRRRRVGKTTRFIPFKSEIIEDRPPPEVLAERDYRRMRTFCEDIPPPAYAGQYPIKAWRIQRMFARGQSVEANQ